ncbi:protein RRP6-like 3 [Coffea eugenioides]|uniref:protein RRP6-like 3 n=1 Tax=Coffea eugenioides TaxID=49369 RepID=UPI000F607C0C|nr:protein RRP6-like 3 [Coffea eugenioides]
MEDRSSKFKLALSITVAVAISIILAVQIRKNRRQKQKKQSKSCYLDTESPRKPQFSFKRVVADNSYSQFKHLKLQEAAGAANGDYVNVHPYKAEIGELLKNLNAEFVELFSGEVEMIGDEADNYVWVETKSQLEDLAEVLSKEKVFGVDTEQHSLRSFLGITSLIQISTKSKDYLVDTIALHDVMGILQPVFADPLICKVFHGADNDILWLQRDFHIYLVNLFDTAKACDVLLKPQKSLAYLLEAYCGVVKNKLLQREDWRQRPLPAEMVQYARTDAHYLLYVANCLTSELKLYGTENSSRPDDTFHFVLEASRRSNAACLQLYTKEIEAYPGESAAASIISRNLNDQGSFQSNCCCETKENCSCQVKFQAVVRRLCAWRDVMARVHDESLRYVLSEQAIGMLAAKVPTTEMEIYDTISRADLNSDSVNFGSFLESPSPVVCSHFEDFYLLFQDNIGKDDDWLVPILQKHLGSDGTCPLSIHNYVLLSKTSLKPTNRTVSKPNGFRAAKQVARMASRELFVQKFSCKSPVYHNCRIFANDGRLLCYCDRKKLDWYLNRDLARLVEDDPPAIMLLFEPKGRPEDEGNDFYIQSKKNICVCCGEGNHYLRYRVIPSCYRMHFPEHLKSHRSHDIVLLCVDCHEIAHAATEKYKKQIATDFGIPLYIRKVIDSDQVQNTSESTDVHFEEVGVSPLQLRTAAMALLRHGPRMPPKRREELTQIVMQYYGGREISDEDLEKALLVGMSPNERKRLGKKRGLQFKHASSQVLVGTDTDSKETCSKQNNGQNLMEMRTDISGHSTCSNTLANGEVSSAHSKGVDSDSTKSRNTNCIPFSVSDVAESGTPLNGATNLICSTYNGNFSSKHQSKYSLLGHGPHGKLVVDHLLKEYGEDGILEFCQKWRQVFVDALHPRFLPAGWDVNHSGKRDFGDFSVYKPVNKVSAATEESGK